MVGTLCILNSMSSGTFLTVGYIMEITGSNWNSGTFIQQFPLFLSHYPMIHLLWVRQCHLQMANIFCLPSWMEQYSWLKCWKPSIHRGWWRFIWDLATTVALRVCRPTSVITHHAQVWDSETERLDSICVVLNLLGGSCVCVCVTFLMNDGASLAFLLWLSLDFKNYQENWVNLHKYLSVTFYHPPKKGRVDKVWADAQVWESRDVTSLSKSATDSLCDRGQVLCLSAQFGWQCWHILQWGC